MNKKIKALVGLGMLLFTAPVMGQQFPYQNTSLTPEQRASDLPHWENFSLKTAVPIHIYPNPSKPFHKEKSCKVSSARLVLVKYTSKD